MKFTFNVAQDPDYDDCWSIYLDNGIGAGAEIAGKIHYKTLADDITASLSTLSQDDIKVLFELN